MVLQPIGNCSEADSQCLWNQRFPILYPHQEHRQSALCSSAELSTPYATMQNKELGLSINWKTYWWLWSRAWSIGNTIHWIDVDDFPNLCNWATESFAVVILLYISLYSNHSYYKFLNSEDFSWLTCIGRLRLPLTLSLIEYTEISNYYPNLLIIPGSESRIPAPLLSWWLCFILSIASTLILVVVFFVSFLLGKIVELLLLRFVVDSNLLLFLKVTIGLTMISFSRCWTIGTLYSSLEFFERLHSNERNDVKPWI